VSASNQVRHDDEDKKRRRGAFVIFGSTLGAMVVGGAVASATVIGVINSQTSPSGDSPANVNQPIIEYGSNA
jgi:hypothetical protein